MREIKFRAFDNVNKRMGFFKPGFSWCDEYYTWDLSAEGLSIMDVPPGDNINFMQFTGLHDKNGKEIYEGDIVQWQGKGMIAAVEWSENKGRWWWGFGLTKAQALTLVVIGNIYENPDLLT